MTRRSVPPESLFRACDPATLGFRTTEDLGALPGVVCQERAVEAVELAMAMPQAGFNVFVLGPEGTGKLTLLRQILPRAAAQDPVPSDVCYVHNFADPRRPRALLLPPGTGRRLRDDMDHLVVELRGAIGSALESESFRAALDSLDDELRKRREQAIEEFGAAASEKGFALIRSPLGMTLGPVREGRALEARDFEAMSVEERGRLEQTSEQLQQQLTLIVRQFPIWEREHRARVRELRRETTRLAVDHLIDELRGRYRELPEVIAHLVAIQEDVIENAQQLLEATSGEASSTEAGRLPPPGSPPWARRYLVNLLVDHSGTKGAPVLAEDYPTFARLMGRVEHVSVLGALMTDFTLVRPGALHLANGGYLILDVRKVLLQPLAWEGLKRALSSGEIRPESVGEALSLISTVTLEPEPIPLRVKVALVGDRRLYYLLAALDPEFRDLFKVQADVDDDVPRSRANTRRYAQMIATVASRDGLAPLNAAAVARVIDQMARHADANDRLSADMRYLSDLLREADRAATSRGPGPTGREDVEAALASQRRRPGRVQERILDAIGHDILHVDTHGTSVGQVNALTVAELGETRTGWPTRVTARARLGRGEVVDIEREVELGGPIHSKGVLILAGYLGERYARGFPLSLHASLTFEQSYGAVEGDSASLAETCALLSAIGGLEVDQTLAVTGSIDQHGRVQAVGAVNEKIEGFFEVCARRPGEGPHGVIIPRANRRSLMLREEVVEAVRAGDFAVHAVETVDEAMALLTGLPAGTWRPAGERYPSRSVNGEVHRRLRSFAEESRDFAARPTHQPAS